MTDDPVAAELAPVRERSAAFRDPAIMDLYRAGCAHKSAEDVPILLAALDKVLKLVAEAKPLATLDHYSGARIPVSRNLDPEALRSAVLAALRGEGRPMARLNDDARAVLRDAGVSEALWDRANFGDGSKWTGDACGCPDDRCKDGFHHYPEDECGCLRTLLAMFLAGDGTFAKGVLPPVPRPLGGFYRPKKLVAERVDEDDEFSGVIVFGTHSLTLAQPLADQLAAREAGSGFRAVYSGAGWWRDGFEHGRRSWVADDEKGRAGVLFGHLREALGEGDDARP